MKLIKERSIAVVFDSVSISKDIVVEGGPLTQNFYAENQSFIPNRFLTPTTLTPKIFITDPNKIIVSGDKHKELLSCEWFENDKKIIDGSDYKIGKDNVLTVLKNSEKDFVISYKAIWYDPRKKQNITIEDSVQFVTIALGDGNIKPRLTLDKAQNWIHNPLKNERIYSIKAYVSKDKLYEGAVEWYCTLKGAEKKLIDTSFLFYEGGQYSNELKVNSAYMPDCIITAKNISDNKLKEIYWFFDKHGNPLTYATPDKTIIEGSNEFSLPESPITSKLDYKIEGLTLTNLVKNGDFRDGTEGWYTFNANLNLNLVELYKTSGQVWFRNKLDSDPAIKWYGCVVVRIIVGISKIEYRSGESTSWNENLIDSAIVTDGSLVKLQNVWSIPVSLKEEGNSRQCFITGYGDIGAKFQILNGCVINLTQTFGAGNEPTKEWCDEHIQGYFEGTKSVTAPLRIKSEVGGRNLLLDSMNTTITESDGGEDIIKMTNSRNLIKIEGVREKKGQQNFRNLFFADNWSDKDGIFKDIQKGVEFTLSMDVRYSGKHSGELAFGTRNPDELYYAKTGAIKDTGGDWIRVYAVKKESGRSINKASLLIGWFYNIDVGDFIEIRNIKLEKGTKPTDWTPAPEDNQPATGGTLYINNNLELKSVGEVKDYIENGKLYKYISDDGEILEHPEIVNLSTQGNLTTYPNGTIFIEPAILVEKQYNDGLKVDLPVKSLTSIKVGADYLDRSKAVVNDNLITHPELENGDNVTIEYIYDENPIRNTNSIGYLSLDEILDELWLENVYTYKITNGKWELVKITDIEDYEKWLKTEKTSPYTLAPDGVIFGKYEADTKFLRQFPSSLYVDFIAPDRLKEGVTQIKARALVGTKNGVIDRPSRYFKITWLKRALRPGQQDIVIGTGDEILVDVGEKDAITIEIEDLGILKALVNEQGEYLTEENNKILVGR